MKKYGSILWCALIMCACASKPEVCSVKGVILDAYNNTIMVQQSDSSTLWIEMDESTDLSACVGIEVGQTIKAECVMKPTSTNTVLQAVKIDVPAIPYQQQLIGSWVEQNPLVPDQVQGFRLMEDGSAKSINTADVVYEKWFVQGRNLVLVCSSVEPMNRAKQRLVYVIKSVDDKSLVLGSEDGLMGYIYSRQ